ncbi:MAG: hypothetical protein ACD_39C01130G0001 [uncultured bacterium]|nr:MAG: hypothetical protein ACD_39C01130G0001 [uncultured bacterium]
MLLSCKNVNNIILLGLFLASAGFLFLASFHIDPQSSMDAVYYHVMAGQLENGAGFTEPFIWHYLNDYTSVEHPMDYWMPLGIIFYYLARLCCGIAGEVWLNILIWSLLSVAVFFEVKKAVGDIICAGFAYCIMIFCGRTLFYLLTTDNIAFYGLLGFLFFKMLGSRRNRWPITALVGGLTALMRIEGIIIAIFGAVFECYKNRRLKVLVGYCFIMLLVLMPWLMRNYFVLGHPWPSNSKALFLTDYSDLFSPDFPGTLSNYLELGYRTILMQKVRGLWISVLNLVAMPGMFVLYPFWLAGLAFSWKNFGKFHAILLLIFVGLCGLAFTLQSERGTAMHISAFFFPQLAVMSGLGLFIFRRTLKISKTKIAGLSLCLVLWVAIFTVISTTRLRQNYSDTYAPYRELVAEQKLDKSFIIASDEPVIMYYLTGAKGVVIPEGLTKWLDKVEKLGCHVVLLDKRASRKNIPDASGEDWSTGSSTATIDVFRRISSKF